MATALWISCLLLAFLAFPFDAMEARAQQATPSSSLSGQVEDSTGAAVADAELTLANAGATAIATVVTDKEGRFAIRSVLPGSYTLTARSDGFQISRIKVTVPPGGVPVALKIVLKVGAVTQTVTVVGEDSYAVSVAGAGTKIDMPLMETPIAVQVIPAQVLADQQTVNLVNAITNVSGVAPTNDGYGTSDSFSIRGFDANSLLYQDGVKLDEYSTAGFPQDMANVDEIEVVKGPASVLYGQAEPGGLVNVVTKKPHENRFATLDQQFGNHAFFRTTADMNQPLVSDKLLFRIVLDGTDANSFRDFIHTNEFNLFPSLAWRPSRFADITLRTSYQKGSLVLDNGIPFLSNGTPANVPLSSNFVDPGLNKSPGWQYSIKPTLTLHLAEDWPLRLQYKFEYHDSPTPVEEIYFGDADSSGNLTRLGFTTPYFHHRSCQVVADMPGKVNFGPIKNTLLIGFDFYKDRGAYSYNTIYPTTINIFNPVYNQPYGPADPAQEGYNTLGFYEYGAYLQDVAELPHKLFILGGVRMNWAEIFEDYAGSYVNQTDVHDRPATPRAGLLWQANPHISLYSSYTSNYGASALGANAPGQKFLPPESAGQVEFGAKSEWLDKRLTASTAVYRIIKHNVPAPDPTNPNLVIAIGTVRTQGVEFDVAGQVSHDLRVIASYSNLQALTTHDTNTPSQQGLPFGSVPHFTGSLWGTWEPQQGNLRGLRLGFGTQTRSGEQAYEYVTLQPDRIPSFAIASLMTGYERLWGKAHISGQVNINNVLNKKYFSNVNPSQAMPGAPFSISPALQIKF